MSNNIKFLNSMEQFTIIKTAHWGSDKEIADIASISYGNEKAKNIDGLINTLMKRGHMSPFEQAGITFYISIPIFVARQLLRYRHISVNEMSRRYTTNNKVEFEFYMPKELDITNDFHSSTTPPAIESIIQLVLEYENYIKKGAKPEIARIILPVNMMTKMYLSTNIRELLHILHQRLKPEAQAEIAYVANKMYSELNTLFPQTYKAFSTYYKEGV